MYNIIQNKLYFSIIQKGFKIVGTQCFIIDLIHNKYNQHEKNIFSSK